MTHASSTIDLPTNWRLAHGLIIALCLVFVTTMWIGREFHARIEEDQAIENRLREVDILSTLLSTHVSRTIRNAELIIDDISAEYRLTGKPFNLRAYARSRQLALDPHNVVAVIDANGDRIMTSLDTNKPANYRKGATFQHFLRTDSSALWISPPTKGRVSGKWTLYLSKRITSADGGFGGVINYGLDPTYFSDLFNEISQGGELSLYLVGTDGIIRSPTGADVQRDDLSDDLSDDLNIADHPIFHGTLRDATSGQYIGRGLTPGSDQIGSFQALAAYPLIAVIESPKERALLSGKMELQRVTLATVGASIVIIFLGTLSVLALSRIERREAEIQSLNINLERLIEDRTRDLAIAQRIAGLGSWVWDMSDDTLAWSEQLYRIAGYRPDEVVPTIELFKQSIHPADRQRVEAALSDAILRDAPYDIDFRLIGADGITRTVSAQGEVERDAQGQPVRMHGTSLDITERSYFEEGLRQAQKMESLGLLAGGVAHSLNNLLVPALTLGAMVRDELPEESLSRQSMDRILEASVRARDLVARVLTFSRQETPSFERIDATELMSQSLELARASVLSTVKLTMNILPDVGEVLVDRPQIESIILNLVANAVDAVQSEEDGRIEVTLQRKTFSGTAPPPMARPEPGNYAMITVSDNGSGMEEEIRQRIFDPFFTTKEVGKGTGLGLSVSHGIIKEHGGIITVESHPGSGSTFRVFLPLAAAPMDDPSAMG